MNYTPLTSWHMAILVVCPGCKKSFNVDDKFAGKTGPCPKCKTKITIPEKKAEVKIHAPDEFSGGGKGVTGKLVLKPIARRRSPHQARHGRGDRRGGRGGDCLGLGGAVCCSRTGHAALSC